MSNLLMKMLQPYMAPADDEASGAGGGGTLDRGDNLDVDKEPQNVDKDEPGAEEKTAEELAAEELAAKAADETPRDKDGKFAKKDTKTDSIPKSRFDEAVTKEREAREAAERRAAEAEALLRKESEQADVKKISDEIKDLNKQHAKLILDGDHEKASQVMDDIQDKIEKRAEMRNGARFAKATAQAVEEVRYDAAVARLEATYPELNPDSDLFDAELVEIVLADQARLVQTSRMTPSDALIKAGEKIMKKFGPSAGKDADKDADKERGLAAGKGDDRRKAQVEKNLDTSKRQPASMKDAGKDSDAAGERKIDVASLTMEEFAALPESTRRKLRGDDA